MRDVVATFVALFWLSAFVVAAPQTDGAKPRPGANKPAAGNAAGGDKSDAANALAERRAVATRQKAAEAAKRLFPKFDANRDGHLDDTEWTKAQAAIDKMVEAEILKTSGPRRELVRDALKNMTRPQVQRNGTDVTPEAVEQYARDLLASAAEVAANAQPEIAPVPPPQVGRRSNSDNGEEPRRGRFPPRLPRPNATLEERAREEALRRKGLQEQGGQIVPIIPGRPNAKPPQANAQGDNKPGKPQRPMRPGGNRP